MGIYHLLKDYWEAEPCFWEYLGLRIEYLWIKAPRWSFFTLVCISNGYTLVVRERKGNKDSRGFHLSFDMTEVLWFQMLTRAYGNNKCKSKPQWGTISRQSEWLCGEKGTFLYCWWECTLVQPLWRTVWRFLKKMEIELPYDPAIPLLGTYTEETRIERDTCTPMFITALFIIARTWKQPRCPSADEWIRKLWYIYTMEY